MKENFDVVVVGGGFFGMYISEFFAQKSLKVLLCEKEHDFMLRASYNNQARVHNGYHYPRSILTALRSRISFPVFCKEFSDCIVDDFEKYYMIGKLLGKVSAKQFKKFCHRIGASCEVAPSRITKLVNPQLIEAVFSTVEYAFDATKLKQVMKQRLVEAKVECRLNTLVKSVERIDGIFNVVMSPSCDLSAEETITTAEVYNCTYSMTNNLLSKLNIEKIPLKHEMTEMCLVEVPDILKNIGITVMCGPFFSIMPFPDRCLHSLSHVRYTPHYQWYDTPDGIYRSADEIFHKDKKVTAYQKMIHDAQRYIPILSECKYHESLWEIKTVLPLSETNDSRPILLKSNYQSVRGLHCILGGM